MRVNANRRPGITLVEVLAAIFVMGIGMLAVLTLYPLGALRMAKALQDSRCGTMAPNADAVATMFDLRNDAGVTAVFAPGYTPQPGVMAPADPLNYSYPVFVDPHYALAGFNTFGPTGISRIAPGFANTAALADRWFGFLDAHTFQSNGAFTDSGGITSLARDWRYSWAGMLRRFRSGDASTTELTVITYSGRPIQNPIAEPTYGVANAATTSVGNTNIVLQWDTAGPQEKPALRRGGWLFDATYKARTANAGAATGYIHSEFYRVMETSDLPNYTDPNTGTTYAQLSVDVQPPLRHSLVQQMVVLTGAVEVFERGNGRK